MIEYGSFEASDFPGMEQVDSEKVQLLLDDLTEGGYMGATQKKSATKVAWPIIVRCC